jgi:hypothetical protein
LLIQDHLMEWFKEMSKQIDQLSYDDSTVAGRKISNLVQAVDEVLFTSESCVHF